MFLDFFRWEIVLVLALLVLDGQLLQSQTLDDPTVTTQDNFGYSIAIQDERVLVGARRDDTFGTNVGQAHMFDRTTGSIIATFNDPTPTLQDNFGTVVDFDLRLAVIGSPQDATNGILGGQAYLFDSATGSLLETFNDPTPTSSDLFGTSAAISGNRVVVGAPGDDSNGLGIGQAHLFDTTDGSLIATLNDPTGTSFDNFGQAVAIDGNLVAVGEPGDDTKGFNVGQVHLFSASDGEFLMTLSDPTVTSGDSFGTSVAVYDDQVLVGVPADDSAGEDAGQAHLFDSTDGSVVHTFYADQPMSFDEFGVSVAIHGDRILIGSPRREIPTATGKAYLFDANSGKLLDSITAKNKSFDNDFYAMSVDLSDQFAAIGIPLDDSQGSNVGQVELLSLDTKILGDVNLDGDVNLLDVSPFVELLLNSGFQNEADINQDGVVDLLDVNPFVEMLVG